MKPSKTQWNPVGPQKIESTAKKKKSSSRVLARRVWWWNVPPCHRSAPHSCHWRLTGRPTGPPEEKKERMNEWKNVNYLSTAAGRPSSSSSSGSTFFFLSLPFSFFPFWRWKKREKLIKKTDCRPDWKKVVKTTSESIVKWFYWYARRFLLVSTGQYLGLGLARRVSFNRHHEIDRETDKKTVPIRVKSAPSVTDRKTAQ